MNLLHQLDRSLLIQARPATVFRFFTDPDRWASWWGKGSTIDARPGGRMRILYSGSIEAVGEVLEIAAPERIVFTYGYASGKPIPPGSSRVTILLEEAPEGTRLRFKHEFPDAAVRDEHVQGWRYQLSLFANVVADEVYSGAGSAIDAWCAAWSTSDESERTAALQKIVVPGIRFRDRYSAVEGVDELSAQIGGYLRFMPGVRLETRGHLRHCQGTALADWASLGADGREIATGSNVYVFEAGGRIAVVVALTNPSKG